MIKFGLAAGTNVGLVRTNNEDNFVVNSDLTQGAWTLPQSATPVELGPYGSLLVVADGMGGANAGEVASAIAIETIQQVIAPDALKEALPIDTEGGAISDDDVVRFMCDAIKTADINIVNRSKTDSSTRGMGTTIVMAWVLQDKAYVAWCGDSRCYLFNENSGLIRLTKDHSYVQDLVDAGKLDEENAFDHPYSNIITRCLGDQERRAEPDARVYTLHGSDVLLLCSDGLHGLCRDEVIMLIVSDYSTDMQACRDALIQSALDAGGHDNVTVALCRIDVTDSASATPLNTTLPVNPTPHHLGLWLLALVVALIVGAFCFTPAGEWLNRFAPADTLMQVSADTNLVDSVAPAVPDTR